MAKIRLQTRYTLLCYIIQFTAAGSKGDVGGKEPALRVGEGVQKGIPDKILGKGRVGRARTKDILDLKGPFFRIFHEKDLLFPQFYDG